MADHPLLPRDQQPFSFRDWQPVLGRTSLSPATRDALQRQIVRFLHACKQAHAPATVAFAQTYLAQQEHGAEAGPSAARLALRWFFSRGRYEGPFDALLADAASATRQPAVTVEHDAGIAAPRASLSNRRDEGVASPAGIPPSQARAPSRPMEPLPAALDRGGADWERDLIAAMRSPLDR